MKPQRITLDTDGMPQFGVPPRKSPLEIAAENARTWRDSALSAPLAPTFAIGQEWAAFIAEFEKAGDTTTKIEVAQRAASAMQKRSDDLRRRLRPTVEYQAEYEADRLALQDWNAAQHAARKATAGPPPVEPAHDIADAFNRRGISLSIGASGKLLAMPAAKLTAADRTLLAHRAADLLAELKSQTYEVA